MGLGRELDHGRGQYLPRQNLKRRAPRPTDNARGRPRARPSARASSSSAPERRAQGCTQKNHPPFDRSNARAYTIF